MNLDYDIKERVSKLGSMGRKICSDLRNLQKERIILSREAKCLLRKFEKEEPQKDRNKTTISAGKPCSCAVWESDLRKDDENNTDESTKSLIMQNEEFCTCTNFYNECCQHNVSGHDSNMVCKYSTSRCNKYEEPFYSDHFIKNIYNSYIDDNVTIEDEVDDDNNLNNVDELIKYCESPRMINSSHLCNLCVFCEDDDTKDTDALSTDQKFHFNMPTKTNTRELIERERGGGGKSDAESITIENLSNQSICTCECNLCVLRNKHGNRPPCYKRHEEIYSFFDIDQEDDLLLNGTTCLELPEISQVTII
ncbi:uncharacterized protein LOC122517895 [Polistes fuscatus]|uniref:uncharacterized protein LOC122517895 n=1 Tax=Polistes fuscatus TaxID=30207 RepID=UPI001CA7FF50|nr:uncharacterized protein LOC122517895 [Polistes fuscatus]